MDGKNASGRRISLLNDSAVPAYASSLGSRTSSYSSSLYGSSSTPPTPQLVRSHSSDSSASDHSSASSDSGAMQTPSPITPKFSFDSMASPVFAHASFFPLHKGLNGTYPPVHVAGASDASYFGSQQAPEPRSTSASASASASASSNPRSKKNSYPCPMAKQFNCNDYFTTSGHAARHAKKHTGKKDAFCPECNKAFTRKDNMEQHRRTHQSGRNATKASDSTVKQVKQQAKRPKPASIQANMPAFPLMDPLLSTSPASAQFVMAPAVQPVDAFSAEFAQRPFYPDPTVFAMTQSYSIGSSYGLDALAIAASGEKRKYES